MQKVDSAIFLSLILLGLAGCTALRQPVPPTPLPATAVSSTPTAIPTPAPTLAPTTTPTSTALPAPTPDEKERAQMTTQLLQAAAVGDTAAVQQLLQAGADINAQDDLGRTPVMAATHGNHSETVQALIQAGADIDRQDNRLDNPFLYAGAEGLMEILRLTIAAGADTTLTNRYGGTALIPAAERGHVAIVAELLAHTDVDIDHINNLGWTALLEAIVLSDGGERHQQIVQMLVNAGADISIADKDGVTPLAHAQARGFGNIQAILQAAQARDLQLISAAGQGEMERVKEQLAKGASVHAADGNGVTALIAAAYGNHTEVAHLLIDAGADVNRQDQTQQSAYLISTSDGFLELLRMTLAAGGDVHSRDSYNGTGLIRAADRGHVEIIDELLKTDIAIDHINRLGWTALLEAIILGDGGPRHTEVVRRLVEAGADVNLADGNGITPLAHARSRGFVQMATILESAGAR
ncbi:MAG: ankyrin repeat domain-containing protein [Caldilineaceae bacterium]